MRRTFLIHMILAAAVLANGLYVPGVQAQEISLPAPKTILQLSPQFNPVLLKGITVNAQNPFQFDFIVGLGDERPADPQLRETSQKLIKYFLASLTVPEDQQWVNLSPYEKQRIVPESLGMTDMGRDLLAQDYILKQITASLIYPQDELGKKFWQRVYAEAGAKFGTTEVPVNTFNKVWIVPDKVSIYEHGPTAMIVENRLKVMMEEDYLALSRNAVAQDKAVSVGSQIVREIIIPQLTKEVNEGKNFAPLRQMYSAMLLATWYKIRLKESVLGRAYIDQNKVTGVDIADREAKLKIYQKYLEAFKKGAFNFIQEEQDAATGQIIPRKYFAGGTKGYSIDAVQKGITKDKASISKSDVEGNNAVTIEWKAQTVSAVPIHQVDGKDQIHAVIKEWMSQKRFINLNKSRVQQSISQAQDGEVVLLYAGEPGALKGVLLAFGKQYSSTEFDWDIDSVEAVGRQGIGRSLVRSFVEKYGEEHFVKTDLVALNGGQTAWVDFFKGLGFRKGGGYHYYREPGPLENGLPSAASDEAMSAVLEKQNLRKWTQSMAMQILSVRPGRVKELGIQIAEGDNIRRFVGPLEAKIRTSLLEEFNRKLHISFDFAENHMLRRLPLAERLKNIIIKQGPYDLNSLQGVVLKELNATPTARDYEYGDKVRIAEGIIGIVDEVFEEDDLDKLINIVKGDAAMAGKTPEAVQSQAKNGGIDFNPVDLDMNIRKDKGMPALAAAKDFNTDDIRGFYPVIIKISPITDLPVRLGLQ